VALKKAAAQAAALAASASTAKEVAAPAAGKESADPLEKLESDLRDLRLLVDSLDADRSKGKPNAQLTMA